MDPRTPRIPTFSRCTIAQQIPPGQVGGSQQYFGLSQQSGPNAQNQSWGHNQGTPVVPRPQVQGLVYFLLSFLLTYMDFYSIPWESTSTTWSWYSTISETYPSLSTKWIYFENSYYPRQESIGQNPKHPFGPILETRWGALRHPKVERTYSAENYQSFQLDSAKGLFFPSQAAADL